MLLALNFSRYKVISLIGIRLQAKCERNMPTVYRETVLHRHEYLELRGVNCETIRR